MNAFHGLRVNLCKAIQYDLSLFREMCVGKQ